MTMILPDEQLLTGKWVTEGGKVYGDGICQRINWLLAHHLRKVADSTQSGGWETLYQDPDDGRYWERSYPRSELHGGGPPQLRCLTVDQAQQKYGPLVLNS